MSDDGKRAMITTGAIGMKSDGSRLMLAGFANCTHCAATINSLTLSIVSATDCTGSCQALVGGSHYKIVGSFPRGPWDGVQVEDNPCLFNFVVPLSLVFTKYSDAGCTVPIAVNTITSITFSVLFSSGSVQLFASDISETTVPFGASIGSGGGVDIDETVSLDDGNDCAETYDFTDTSSDDTCFAGASLEGAVFALTVT